MKTEELTSKEFLEKYGERVVYPPSEIDAKKEEQILSAFAAASAAGATPLEMNTVRSKLITQLMYEYLANSAPKKIEPCTSFLKELMRGMNLKHKQIARYLGIKEPNLSAILKGRRKINLDMAMKLGKIFNIAPELLLNVQTKNDILRLEQKERAKYDHYSMLDLMQQINNTVP